MKPELFKRYTKAEIESEYANSVYLNPEWYAITSPLWSDPENTVQRRVIADWLEEHGEVSRAEMIRHWDTAARAKEGKGLPETYHVERLSPKNTKTLHSLFLSMILPAMIGLEYEYINFSSIHGRFVAGTIFKIKTREGRNTNNIHFRIEFRRGFIYSFACNYSWKLAVIGPAMLRVDGGILFPHYSINDSGVVLTVEGDFYRYTIAAKELLMPTLVRLCQKGEAEYQSYDGRYGIIDGRFKKEEGEERKLWAAARAKTEWIYNQAVRDRYELLYGSASKSQTETE